MGSGLAISCESELFPWPPPAAAGIGLWEQKNASEQVSKSLMHTCNQANFSLMSETRMVSREGKFWLGLVWFLTKKREGAISPLRVSGLRENQTPLVLGGARG